MSLESHRRADAIRSIVRRRGWVGGIVALIAIGLVFLDLRLTRTAYRHFTPTTNNRSGRVGTMHFSVWQFALFAIGIIMMFLGLLFFSVWADVRNGRSNQRSAQVKKLSDALDEALKTISSVRIEVEEGQRVLNRLQKEITTNKDLARLTSEQSKAVEELVRMELRRERLPSLSVQIVVGLLLIGVGILIAHA
jgi:ABC-type multidrug transport system fused ATPase/permease subunit